MKLQRLVPSYQDTVSAMESHQGPGAGGAIHAIDRSEHGQHAQCLRRFVDWRPAHRRKKAFPLSLIQVGRRPAGKA